MSHQKEDLNYRVKQINFGGRTYPILLQDVNGPCPILAIANVLLLRGQLKLPAGALGKGSGQGQGTKDIFRVDQGLREAGQCACLVCTACQHITQPTTCSLHGVLAGVGEVSEERLVQLVAGYLLDATSLEGREGQVNTQLSYGALFEHL